MHYKEQFPIFIFGTSLKKKMLYGYKENTQNGKISTTSVYISVNNNMNLIFLDSLYLHYTALYMG
jgi:hypothetical protein